MGYFYRIILNDKTVKDVMPSHLVNKNLSAFDNFSMSDDFTRFIDETCASINISKYEISEVKIGYSTKNKRDIEYNLLKNNPYFYDIFMNISEKEVWEYNRYQAKREIVSAESECYQEMRDYVLDQLKNNAKVFLNDIYRYPNKFKEIFEKYAKSYESSDLIEEDYHNLYEIETTIRHHLTIYKLYRSVAAKRYQYEKSNYYAATKKIIKKEGITPDDKAISNKLMEQHYDNLNTVTHRTKEYNEKYDEFIEPDEYGQMNGYTGGRVL